MGISEFSEMEWPAVPEVEIFPCQLFPDIAVKIYCTNLIQFTYYLLHNLDQREKKLQIKAYNLTHQTLIQFLSLLSDALAAKISQKTF